MNRQKLSSILPLLDDHDHSLTLVQARTELVRFRVKLTALIIGTLMLGWIPVDLYFMPWESIKGIIAARIFLAAALSIFLFYQPRTMPYLKASGLLAILIAIPAMFFLYANSFLQHQDFDQQTQFVKSSYAHFSLLVAMLLSLFPLTAKEGLIIGSGIGIVTLVAAWIPDTPAHMLLDNGAIWIHVVVTILAIIAGMSQLHFMAGFVEYSTRDEMTGSLKRDYGLRLLEEFFFIAERRKSPCCLIFVDLDYFKKVNDVYGHDKGDDVLKEAAMRMRSALRRQDALVRWGGEEFIIILPNTDMQNVHYIFDRLKSEGLGFLPDGSIQTASIGIAEYLEDEMKSPQELISLADQRMYASKKGGRNRVTMKNNSFLFALSPQGQPEKKE